MSTAMYCLVNQYTPISVLRAPQFIVAPSSVAFSSFPSNSFDHRNTAALR